MPLPAEVVPMTGSSGDSRLGTAPGSPDGKRTASTAVARAVADAVGADPTEIEPLYDRVDPEALDALLDAATGSVAVEFRVEGCRVRVEGGDRPVDVSVDPGRP